MAPSQQQTAVPKDTALHLNDLVSLPIIITDFDADTTPSHKKSDDQTPPSAANSAANDAALQKWSTGFNDFADEMWRSMTEAMRSKLREAAVEVLKRTDDVKSGARGDELWGQWDEDARFLD